MMDHMKHMPSLPTLASALCHIATIAVVMRGRTDLGTAPGVAGGSHRHLESAEPPHDPLAMDPLAQTVARLEKAVAAGEKDNAELRAILNEQMQGGEAGKLKDVNVQLEERVSRLKRANHKNEQPTQNRTGIKIQLPMGTTGQTNATFHRRAQATPQACERVYDFQALTAAAMDACCPASGGGHRRMQANCDLPPTCPSVTCAAVFVPYIQDCASMLATMPDVQLADFQSFAATCTEMQVGAGQMLQPVVVQMFRVLVNTEGAAQAGAMFPGDGEDGLPPDPLQPLPPAPLHTSPSDSTGGDETTTGVTQYHAECTSADVASCVPACNAEHHGYELLATIDGTDTKFSCNLAHGL